MIKFILFSIWRHRKSQSRNHTERENRHDAYRNKAQSESDLKGRMQELPLARVKWVIDGDTVVVTQGWKETVIRLDSIDCPEDNQRWGDIAKYGLIKLISQKNIRLEIHGADHHGRTLATIHLWNEYKYEWLNINERMVTLGHAWVMRRYYDHLPRERQEKLNRLERWAQSKKVGLWAEDNPIPPWEWRGRQ